MKVLIASDIHGSELHCGKLIRVCYQEQVETLLLLGDILDGNKEVAAMLNSLSKEKTILCVRGNCDYPEDQLMLDFPIMAEYCLLFVGDRLVFATHGHRSIPNLSPGSILLHGPLMLQHGNKTKQAILTYVLAQFLTLDETVSVVI